MTERSSRQTLPCSSPPRHSENGCSALGGFCSCFASSETAAKAHTRAAAAAVAAAPYPKTYMSSRYSSSNTGCPATSWRPTLCALSPRMQHRLPTSLTHPVNLYHHTRCCQCVYNTAEYHLSLSLSVTGELATRYFKIKGSASVLVSPLDFKIRAVYFSALFWTLLPGLGLTLLQICRSIIGKEMTIDYISVIQHPSALSRFIASLSAAIKVSIFAH